jgi:hypothetical protein
VLAGREVLVRAPVASGLRFLLTVLRVVPELEPSCDQKLSLGLHGDISFDALAVP